MATQQAARTCLDDDEVVALVAGDCDEATRGELLRHAVVCDVCQRVVGGAARALRSDDDEDDDDDRVLPTTIGRYRVCRELGRGGMGVVYEAIDPRLDRKVAIKQLRASVVDRHSDRLQGEARTLARLNHPNVVVVFEAGADHVVMELIDGEPLHVWQHDREWREILACYLDAGRGLAAAHAVGVVHRDFKPHNVLVGNDGRVRVADFGLAALRTPTHDDLGSVQGATSSGLAGTPAYLAPERFLGQPADAASDQFAFCVSLFEGLAGVRPFPGDDVAALATAVVAGDLARRPRSARRVPGRIWRVIERGLEREPADRWPSMTALVHALQSAATGTRRRWAAASVLACGAALVAIAATRTAGPAVCRGEGIAEAWDSTHARAIEAVMLESGLEYARATATTAVDRLDAYAQAWTDARAEICAEPLAMEDAAACLEDEREVVRELVDRMAGGDSELVAGAAQATARLPSPRRCLEPSKRPALSPATRELARTIATERALVPLGLGEDDLPRIERLVPMADATDDPLLAAEARLVYGVALAVRLRWEEAIALLEDAYFRAYENGDDAMACDASTNIALGHQWLGRHAEALEWTRRGRASATTAEQRADVASIEGDVLFALGRLDEAELAVADALADQAPSHARVSALTMLATLRAAKGEFAAAEAILLDVIALIEREAGHGHPDLARPLNMLGITRIQQEQPRAAIEPLQRAAALLVAKLGEQHALVGQVLGNLAVGYGAMGEHELAYNELLRVLEIFESSGGREDARIAITLHNLANQAMHSGRPADALRYATRAMEIVVADEVPDGEDAIATLSLVARGRRGVGDLTGSLAAWDEVLARRHAITPSDDDALGWAELETAITAQQAREIARAREHIARALEHYARSDQTSPREQARVHVVAARIASEHDEIVGHLRNAWTRLAGSTEPRESATRLDIARTWAELGGTELAPWDAITSR